MNFIERYLPYKILVFVAVFLCATNVLSVVYFLKVNVQEPCVCEECPLASLESEEKTEKEAEKIKVDIKGYVKKPGVYELDLGMIVNDLIKLAGGLKTNGTTENINLSKKLNNEDMIVILSKSELKKQTTISSVGASSSTQNSSASTNNNSDLSTTQIPTSKKISLNNATKEELMTLEGIGEAKANSIIEYRGKTPFQDVSEIMNVSGIGESVYEKIKDNITI